MGLMSKRKGRLGEQEVRRMLTELLGDLGTFERNSMQAHNLGKVHQKDILTNLPLSIEVKRTEAKLYRQFIEQARAQTQNGELPVLFHRSNGEPWRVVMELTPAEFAHLIRAWHHFHRAGRPGLRAPLPALLQAAQGDPDDAAE
jgi:hypothetical protein